MYREPDLTQPQLAAAPDCRFEPAPADGVLPDGFLSTTNHPTYVVVNKLKDRGTHQAFDVITNAQDFMRLLELELSARLRG